MKHLVPLVLAAALLAGCTEPRPAASTATPTPTPSATAATAAASASRTPTATPASVGGRATAAPPQSERAWDTPPKSGNTRVDALVAAVVAQDAGALASHVTGVARPCGKDPECPPGSPPGTVVTEFHISGVGGPRCIGDGRTLDLRAAGTPPVNSPTWTTPQTFAVEFLKTRRYLRLVMPAPRGTYEYDSLGVRLRVAFQSAPDAADEGTSLLLSEHGIVGVSHWGAANCAPVPTSEALITLPPQSP